MSENKQQKEKRKILFVITKGNFGGAQRYVLDLASHLPKEKFDVVVALGEGQELQKRLNEANIRCIRINSLGRDISIFKDISAFFELRSIIRCETPNIVHLNSSKVGLMGVIIVRLMNLFSLKARSYKLKAIFTGHGWAFNERRNWLSKIFFWKLHWLTVVLSHQTICVSRRNADQILHAPFIKKKVKVIYNGISEFELFTQEKARTILAASAGERIWIGNIAELHDNKGQDLLIKAFAPLMEKYANLALIIVGSGEEESELKKLSNTLGIQDKVYFSGFIPEARKYLKAFDIFAFPSRTENLPYAILEAGMAKIPIVSSWVGGIPEIIANEENGILLDPSNTEKFTMELDELVAKNDLREKYSNALFENIQSKFNLDKMVRETIAIY